jgi:hypothetical protein
MADPLQLIISFLGGGIIVALINWARIMRSERTSRKHDFLREQIGRLYGPLNFFVGLTEALFELNNRFHQAYNEHFVNQEWSNDARTRETLRREAEATLELANDYVGMVNDNSAKIVDILREHYAYADPDDTEIFQRFIIDHLRMKREAANLTETPFEVYLRVGQISFSRPEFLDLVKKRFSEKNKAIQSVQ